MRNRCGGQKLCFTVLTALILVGVGDRDVQGYGPPSRLGESNFVADANNPRTHGTIVLQAIEVLRADGHTGMGDFFAQYKQPLLNGVMQADYAGGELQIGLEIAGKEIEIAHFDRNSMTHFYNPSTGKGLILDLGDLGNTVADIAEALSIGPWEIATVLGPHPAATDMADWSYAQAVDAMRRGQVPEALTHLGWTLHYLQDCTVPQHTTDQSGATPGANHTEYEDACDTLIAQANFPHAQEGGIYHDEWQPGQFVKEAAKNSAPLLHLAKNPGSFESAAQQMIPLAERLTAGLMARFFRRWDNENFAVTVLTIDRVRDPTGDIDSGIGPEADFYAKVSLSGRKYPRTVTIHGGDDVRPNKPLAYCWVFPQWLDLPALPQGSTTADRILAPRQRIQRRRRDSALPGAPSFRTVAATIEKPSRELRRSPQRRMVLRRQTRLEVDPWGGEFSRWVLSHSITSPQSLKFRWSTEEQGVDSARWVVTAQPYVANGNVPVQAQGELTTIPAPDRVAYFNLDFGTFIPPEPPANPVDYYVQVVPRETGTGKERTPSAPVVITYCEPGPGTEFNFEEALHPRVSLAVYTPVGKVYQESVAPTPAEYSHAALTLDIYNPHPTATTDAVNLSIRDETPSTQNPLEFPLFRSSSLVQIPALKPGARQTVHVTLTPNLASAAARTPAGEKKLAGGIERFWKGQFLKGHLTLVAHTTAKDQLKQNLTSSQTLTQGLRARRAYPSTVPMHLEIWDEDGGLAGDDDHCDINPRKGPRNLDFTYFLDGSLRGDVMMGVNDEATVVHTQGAGEDDDEDDDIAGIWFKIEHWPRIPAHSASPRILRPHLIPQLRRQFQRESST